MAMDSQLLQDGSHRGPQGPPLGGLNYSHHDHTGDLNHIPEMDENRSTLSRVVGSGQNRDTEPSKNEHAQRWLRTGASTKGDRRRTAWSAALTAWLTRALCRVSRVPIPAGLRYARRTATTPATSRITSYATELIELPAHPRQHFVGCCHFCGHAQPSGCGTA